MRLRPTHAALLALALLEGCVRAGSTPAPRTPRGPVRASALTEGVLPLVERASQRHGVPADLVLGVIQVESSFNPRARSPVGAQGLMQLMPRTAESLARQLGREDYDLEDPEFNIEAGTFYLSYLLRLFEGDTEAALAAYNTGPYRVLRWRREGRALADYSVRYAAAVLAARDAFKAGGSTMAVRFSPASRDVARRSELDRDGLRSLVRSRRQLYGERPDEALEGLPRFESLGALLRSASQPAPNPEDGPQSAPADAPGSTSSARPPAAPTPREGD